MLAAALALASCGGQQNEDKNDGTGTETGPDTEVKANVNYTVNGGSDMTVLFAIEATYTEANGESVTETVEALPWNKSLTEVTAPFTANLSVRLTPLTDYPEQEVFACGLGTNISYTSSDNIGSVGDISAPHMNVSYDRIADYQESASARDYSRTIEVK